MNERIRQLAEQAGFALWGKEEWNPGDVVDWSARYDRELEKFTELVVRECIKESMDEIVSEEDIAREKDPLIQEYLKGNNQGIVDAVVRFKNYFGVES